MKPHEKTGECLCSFGTMFPMVRENVWEQPKIPMFLFFWSKHVQTILNGCSKLELNHAKPCELFLESSQWSGLEKVAPLEVPKNGIHR